MKRPIAISAIGAFTVGGALVAATIGHIRALPNQGRPDGSRLLPNGWAVHPAGRAISLPGDMPLKMLWSQDGKKLIVSTGGWHDQGVAVIDSASEKVIDKTALGSAWAGMALDGDHLYVSGGPEAVRNLVYRAGFHREADFGGPVRVGLDTARTYYGAGIVAVDGSVWVANTDADWVQVFQGRPKKSVRVIKVGYRPYSLVLSPDRKTVAVSNWGDSSVGLIDVKSGAVRATVKVGSHPNEMVYSRDGRLFVAEGGSNRVSVIRGTETIESIRTSLDPKDLIGSTPDALAISPDNKTLYVANADNNDVAVVDITRNASRVEGFIPTGWYPSALAISPDGKKLFIGTAKGLGFRANSPSQTPYFVGDSSGGKYDYIAGVLSGHVSVVDVPNSKQLATFTNQVASNTPKNAVSPDENTVLSKIKHVVYVIRENRTYDQVFGDLKKGNGDSSLVMFGKAVTPNAHKMASDFVLLDNLYCNGEVSQDGHQWCDAAYATDFTERAWVNSYAGRGEPDADDRLDASPAGYLWDLCKKHGVSYRSYGEGGGFSGSRSASPIFSGAKGLEGHASLEWSQQPSREVGGRDSKKIDIFIRDLHEAEKTGTWPQLNIVALPEDHTFALSPGAYTPDAAVASNDLAIGKLVQEISHSKFWEDTAIFMIEDDAQDGPDHVDAHRTVGLLVSPYVKRGSVDSGMYTTASMVRTMELILGLPPMNQFDEKATPMYGSFTSKPDLTPYDMVEETVALDARNPKSGELEVRSSKLDWSAEDRANPAEFNRILWAYRHPHQVMPPPTRGLQAMSQR